MLLFNIDVDIEAKACVHNSRYVTLLERNTEAYSFNNPG